MPELKDRTEFYELTDKQKSVVNVKAEHPEYKPQRVAEEASKKLPGDESVSKSYIHPILNKYGEIIKERREQLNNDRYEGESKAVGNPLQSGPLQEQLEDSETWQGIKDRPEKGENGDSQPEQPAQTEQPQQTQQPETTSDVLQIRVHQEDVEELLTDQVPEDLKAEIVNQLMRKAF